MAFLSEFAGVVLLSTPGGVNCRYVHLLIVLIGRIVRMRNLPLLLSTICVLVSVAHTDQFPDSLQGRWDWRGCQTNCSSANFVSSDSSDRSGHLVISADSVYEYWNDSLVWIDVLLGPPDNQGRYSFASGAMMVVNLDTIWRWVYARIPPCQLYSKTETVVLLSSGRPSWIQEGRKQNIPSTARYSVNGRRVAVSLALRPSGIFLSPMGESKRADKMPTVRRTLR